MPTTGRAGARAAQRLLALVALSGLFLATATTVGPAAPVVAVTDGCATWDRLLRTGSRGTDVRRLQVRVSGYPGYGRRLSVDGIYGRGTAAAVWRFQRAHGLAVDGIAGPQTFRAIDRLQDDDCTPRHFSFGELDDGCGFGGYGGGLVSRASARAHALVTMWKLEALRGALGGRPLAIASGFRSHGCNRLVGGATRSRHLFGDAADVDPGASSLCTIARRARHHGFAGIYGPGYPRHDGHVHLDGAGISWRAPRCGM